LILYKLPTKGFYKTLRDLGISQEGANLSGLPEKATALQNLIVCMAEELHKKKTKAKNEKKKAQQAALTAIEKSALKSQGKISQPINSTPYYCHAPAALPINSSFSTPPTSVFAAREGGEVDVASSTTRQYDNYQ
jgi:hypothetical protein